MSVTTLLMLAAQSSFTVTNSSYDVALRRPANARLVWKDEFDGERLDTANWEYDTARNKEGWYNGELQYYSAARPENLRVGNGVLRIEARRETLDPAKFPDWGGQKYTSARISRRARVGLMAFTRFERSCRALAGPGRRSGCSRST